MNNQKAPAPSPAVLPSVARKEPERSERDWSATDGKTGANPKPHPDPEVAPQAKRRQFTAEYKQRIPEAADQAAGSLLTTWRREREAGVRQALTTNKRGPKSKRDPLQEATDKPRRENERLTEQLRKAEIVIDVQKKVAALLGWPLPAIDPEPKP